VKEEMSCLQREIAQQNKTKALGWGRRHNTTHSLKMKKNYAIKDRIVEDRWVK